MNTKKILLASAGLSLIWSVFIFVPFTGNFAQAQYKNFLTKSSGELQNEALFLETLERWVRSFGRGGGNLKSVEINFDEDRFVDNFFVSYKQKNSSNKEEEYGVWQYTSSNDGQLGFLFKQDYWADDDKTLKNFSQEELEAHTKDLVQKEDAFIASLENLSQEVDFEIEEVQHEKNYDKNGNRIPSSLLSIRIRPKSSVPNTRFKLKYVEIGLKIRLSHFVVWVNVKSRNDNPLFQYAKEQLTAAVYAMERGKIPELTFPLSNVEEGGEVLPRSLIQTVIETLGISDLQ